MPERGDDPAAIGAPPATPATTLTTVTIPHPEPGDLWARVFQEIDGKRVLLANGIGVTIIPGVPEAPAGDLVPREVGALPDAPLRAAIDAALIAGPLGREAGLATWVRTPVLHRLRYGLDEEHASVERLVGHYGVDLRGLLDKLAAGALRCQIEGHSAPITPTHCQAFREAADALAARRKTLAAVCDGLVRREVDRGWNPTQAVELLDLDALQWTLGLAFEDVVFDAPTAPLQRAILVLLRAVAAVGRVTPWSPETVQEQQNVVACFDQAACLLEACRPSIGGRSARAMGFLAEIRATERLLRAVRPRSRRVGRPRFIVEREVASDLVAFLL
jgi:hypothetical protein